MHSATEYKLITTIDELIGFQPVWQRLWRLDPRSSPFQSPQWLVPWWRQFGNQHLCSVAISRGAEPVGFLPFYIFYDPKSDQHQLLPIGVGTTDYLDGIFAPECSPEGIAGAIDTLCESFHHDVLCAPQLPAHSRLLAAFGRSRGPRTFVSTSDACSRMAAVSIAELPQKIRRNAMYYRNRAQRRGTLELVQANDSNCLEIFEKLRSLHAARWKNCGEEGVFADERVSQWHREAIPNLLDAGLLRLMALHLNGEVIAVLYSLVDRLREGRVQYFYITAYSPEHADLRPGTLLIAYAVERAAREGISIIDMLRGDESYKQIWHMEKTPTWCVTQFQEPARTEADRRETAA